jgi:protein arginine N-methyltransferase 1
MGYFLLFESMLPSVIFARDKWLNTENKTAGVYPNEAMMYIAGAERKGHNARHVGFWENVYGFDMSCLIDDRYGQLIHSFTK